jgi:hypothetical protein
MKEKQQSEVSDDQRRDVYARFMVAVYREHPDFDAEQVIANADSLMIAWEKYADGLWSKPDIWIEEDN